MGVFDYNKLELPPGRNKKGNKGWLFRKELIERFRKLLNALEVDFEATHNATIGGYIARIDELIADTMASAKGVKTRRDNEPGESEQPEPPTA